MSVLFDWIAREGWIVFNWWLLATIAGYTALPMVMKLLPALPDQGYSLSRPAGMLLVTVVFWLLAVLGFVDNSPGSIVLAWILVLIISLTVFFSGDNRPDVKVWWTENRRLVVAVEVLFIVLLLGWAVVRAHQNSFSGTEKPMDLAFMSAVQRSETFPPNDPWLSGYIISYYYMGYVMASMMSMMSGVWSTTGYNMHIAMLFALVGVASFGITYNLVRSRTRKSETQRATSGQNKSLVYGLLGMTFLLLLSNFNMILVELPYRSAIVSDSYLEFWDTKSRITLDGRTEPQFLMTTASAGSTNWWWFDASRSITERDLNGQRVNEVIDEFPMFSFLLADSHPHVMALPYALLALGIALNVALLGRKPNITEILFYGVVAGALVFLNTWDSPIYIALIVGADAVRRLVKNRVLRVSDWLELFVLGVSLVAVMIVTYLPFLVGFQSQLAGVLPNLQHPTRFQQIFVMFGPFIILLSIYLAVEVWRGGRNNSLNLKLGLQVALGALAACLGVVLLLLIAGRLVPSTWAYAQQFAENNGGWSNTITEIILRRLSPLRLFTTVFLLIGIFLIVARLFPKKAADDTDDNEEKPVLYPPATGFSLLLVGLGISLVLIPEFFYLRDNFGTRMNTVFKFYYQAWVAFSIASAYGVYSILSDGEIRRVSTGLRVAFGSVVGVILMAGLLYGFMGTYHRMFLETGRLVAVEPPPLTLDGGRTIAFVEDYDVLMCLNDLVEGDDVVVAEATGGSYDFNGSGKTGALTGIPSILGWQGHQGQWRGTAYAESVGSRPSDVPTIYTESRMDVVQPILDRYGVDYILYGSTERDRYGAGGEAKFEATMPVVCESGSSRIYQVNTDNNEVASQ